MSSLQHQSRVRARELSATARLDPAAPVCGLFLEKEDGQKCLKEGGLKEASPLVQLHYWTTTITTFSLASGDGADLNYGKTLNDVPHLCDEPHEEHPFMLR